MISPRRRPLPPPVRTRSRWRPGWRAGPGLRRGRDLRHDPGPGQGVDFTRLQASSWSSPCTPWPPC
ncbi:hypothetical protein QJS66_09280 [Kocuria rhizophila]|nr:hypothetical protein QJS66_09280 [Kocuria rhizophila]